MSDIKSAHDIKSAELNDGTTVYINDHVYLAPEHLGEPYYIGRVMEFVHSKKRKGKLQARIAWFNRPKDVINRKSADHCLLVATMHSDINPVSSIRGKCTVTHKYYVPKDQMEEYRKQQDNFYYNQLYDRYIQRVYDVVPCETVQNVPSETLEALKQRYQFIVVEQGKAADLTVARRTCCVCQEWCQSAASVKCAGCQKSYHMSCLNPPLIRKPSKGFAWQCAFCTRQDLLNDPNSSNTASPVAATPPLSLETAHLHKKSTGSKRSSSTDDHDQKDEKSSKSRKTELKRQTRATRSQLAAANANNAQNGSKSSPQQQQASQQNTPSQSSASPAQKGESSITNNIKLRLNHTKKSQDIKMTHMWPFRYFGVNTDIDDIVDVDDRIYPRAKSRIGAKYQATVADWDMNRSTSPSSDTATSHSPSISSAAALANSLNAAAKSNFKSNSGGKKYDRKKSTSRNNSSSNLSGAKGSVEASPSAEPMDDDMQAQTTMGESSNPIIPTRGGDDTITRIYTPGKLSEEEVDQYMQKVRKLENIPLKEYSADRLDRGLLELERNDYDTVQALVNMSQLTGDDFQHVVEWGQKEIDAFEQSIREHGHDLNFAKLFVKTKTMADIVRFFYQWKKTDRYETVYSEWTKIYRPMKKFHVFPRDPIAEAKQEEAEDEQSVDSTEDSDPTIVPKETYVGRYQCMNCSTEESKIWRRSPSDFDRKRKVFNEVLCNDCGVYWLKYAKTKPVVRTGLNGNTTPTIMPALHNQNLNIKHELMKRKRSHDDQGGGMKSVAKRSKENRHRSVTPLKFTPTACQVCQQTGPTDRLYTCYHCGMSVHYDCYGIDKTTEPIGWLCDPCDNKVHPIASYVYECVLCYQPATTQQPLKRTAGYYWAHVQCATFIPEIKFVHPQLLSPVEYIGCVNVARLEANCSLCDNTKGACVACSECRKTVHVQCAKENNFKLAFEIQPNTHNSNKSTKYPIVQAGLFGPNSPSGLMIPQVWCPHHNVASRKLIDLNARTTDDTQESSLMTYVKKYKCIAKGTTPAMRRFRAARHHQNFSTARSHQHHKLPNPREAVLEALSVDDHLTPAATGCSSTITKLTLTTSSSPKASSSKHVSSPKQASPAPKSSSPQLPTSLSRTNKRVCSTPGCLVQHTPIWWNVADDSEKTICQRCHQKQLLEEQEQL